VIGTTVGQFRILERLGSGSMGVVYRAHDERLRRDVALKVLPPGAIADETSRKFFHREALSLSRLNHPCIATVHEFQSTGAMDCLVMEYIPGESLDERLERGRLPEKEVVAIGLQLAEGLAEAHRQGVIHRDLKPANLRVTPEGRVKILDFGLARLRAAEAESRANVAASTTGDVAGSPAYVAPELLRGAAADERSDLWAAGIVLYESAVGSRPFPGLPTGALLEAIMVRRPPPPRSRNPAISPALESIILRCLEATPDRRYQSAAELAEDLRRLQSGSPIGRRPMSTRRRAAMASAIGLAAICAAVALVAWKRGGFGHDPRAATLRSLAVLPLGNLSGNPEQEYIADGMTEALIAQLSHVHSIRVISLTSVMRYKNRRGSMSAIARELGADGVIEGNVLRSRDHLRTTVHLIYAPDDEQLWSGQYDGDTTDVLRLQSRVARAIVNEIQVRLTPGERARLAGRQHVNSDAYQLYLRGRYQWNRRSDAGIRLAIRYFEEAIARDSTYALLHAGLSDAWAAAGLYGLIVPAEARERARAEALRAVALDPELSEAHTSLAHVLHNFDWDWLGAEQEYLRAIELNPNNAVAHDWHGHLLAQQGRFDEAREELREAGELDPLSLSIVQSGGVNEYFARRYDLALEHYRRAMELDSTSSLLHRLYAGVLDRMGRETEAARELSRSFELRGQPEVAAGLQRAYRAAGMRGMLELLIQGLRQRRAAGAYEPAEHVAELYARLGRIDEAFEWLEVSFREHDTELNRLRVDPIFDPLRKDPRLAGMLHRVGLDAPLRRA
jgi:serine/threonine-protein kinase